MSVPLSLSVLGGFEATLGGEPLPSLPRKSQALLVYLALEGRALHSRSDLATLLWGETGDDQAQQSLRKALSGLRLSLGPEADLLVVQEGAVGLDRSAMTVDAIEFEKLARAKAPESLAPAVALYKGHLLAGLNIEDGSFSEWLTSRRERLRELALGTLSRLLEQQVAAGAFDPAVDTASRLFEMEPLHEPAHRALIRIYGQQGRRAAAARQYQLCVDLLQRELGVKPEPATEAAYRESLEAQSQASRSTPPGGTPRGPHQKAEALPETMATAEERAPASRRNRALAGLAIGVLVTAFAFPWLSSMRSPASPPGPRRAVAILAMKNLSGQAEHAWLQTALTETIGAELMVGGQFRLVSAESLGRMQQALAPPPGLGLTRKQLDEIGRDLGCDLILSGDYLAVGGKIRVDVQLDDVAGGEPVASASVSDDEANLLSLLDRAGDDLRAALHINPPGSTDRAAIRAAFPAAPASRRAYFSGLAALRLRDGPKAAELLQEAVAADPGFALAHAALSTTWRLLGYDKRGEAEARKAFELSGRLSAEDRLNVEAHFHEASFNWAKAIEGFQRLWQAYPDNLEYGLKLGNVLQIASRHKEAQEVIVQMGRLRPPDGADPRIDLLEGTVAERLGDFKRALAAADRAADKAQATRATLLLARARLKQGIYLGRQSAAEQALERYAEGRALFESLGEQGGVADALRWEGGALIDVGRREAGEIKLKAALDIAQPLQYVRLTTEILLLQALAARWRGALEEARTAAAGAVASAREADEESAIARATLTLSSVLKIQGDYAGARTLVLESRSIHARLGEVLARNAATNNLAWLDIEQGRVADAIEALESILGEERKSRSNGRVATRLQNLSVARALQGRSSQAEVLAAEECRLREGMAAKPALASCRVRLALIHLDLGRSAEVKAALETITVTDLKGTPQPSLDLARLAFLHLSTGDRAKAEATLAEGERVLKGREYIPEQAIPVEIMRARLEAAGGRTAAALARLEAARREADRFGLLPLSLESRFASARLTERSGAKEALASVERDAKAAGLEGIALRTSAPPTPRPRAKS